MDPLDDLENEVKLEKLAVMTVLLRDKLIAVGYKRRRAARVAERYVAAILA